MSHSGAASTPIAIFAYNRPAHLRQTLDALARCPRLDECSLHLFCDGPRGAADAGAVAATVAVARDWAAARRAQVIEREANIGLARSIIAGVSELCARHGRVIVVEDDIVVGPGFVDYMLRALDRYADSPRVYQISGYMFPVRHRTRREAFFLPQTTSWGWATWQRAWGGVDWGAADARTALRSRRVRRRFDLGGAYPYSEMLEAWLAGKNGAWDVAWWWATFRAGGRVLHPRRSLVQNIGFDGTGTHCGVDSRYTIPDFAGASAPQRLPSRVVIDRRAAAAISAFLRGDRPGVIRRGASFMRRHYVRLVQGLRGSHP